MTVTPGRVLRLTALLLLAGLPAVLWPGVVAQATALGIVARPEGGAALGQAVGLLGLALPLVSLSAAVLFLAPGLLLALLARRGRSVPAWLLAAVPFAVLGSAWIVLVVQWQLGATAPEWIAGAASLELTAIAGAAVALLATRIEMPWPVVTRRDLVPVAFAVAAVVIGTVLLSPKLLWESFNGDGAHAYEASHLLLAHPVPFFPRDAGVVAGFPGVTSMLFTWPNGWFLRLFGPLDAAVRLPFVIYLPLLVLGLQAIAEAGGRPLERGTQAVLWLGLLPFTLAMAYSASYEPYHADLALPGVQDLLLLVCVAGFIHAMVQRERGWAITFGVLAHLALPNGLVLIGFWLLAECVVMRPWPWWALATGGLTIAACVGLSLGLPPLVAALGHPVPGNEYGLGKAISDVLTVNVLEWRRVAWLLVGAGFLPVFTLAWWRRQDDAARRVTLVALAYFAFFYVQARVSLHHFVPAMVLPLVVAARTRPEAGALRRRYLGWWSAAVAVAIVLAAPRSFAIATNTREVGRTITQLVGNRGEGDPDVFRAATLLSELFPPVWVGAVPDRAYGGSPLAWIHYSRGGAPGPDTRYLLLRRPVPDTLSESVIAADSLFALAALDTLALAADRARRPRTDTRSPVFAVPRSTLFGPGGEGTIDLVAALRRLLGR